MPTTITPANGFDTATAITRAAPGERVGMETGASPLAPLLQRLADHDHTLRLGLLGQMAGGDRMSVDPGGSSTVFAVRVSQIRSVLIQQPSGPWRALSTTGETVLTIADVDGAPASLGSDEWYYVYAYAVGDATARLYITTDPPDDALVWEATSPGLRRYVGCFRTSSAGAPLPFMAIRGRYEYDLGAMATSGAGSSRVLTAGAATSHTSVDCSGVVPPHVQNARLLVGLAPALAGDTFSTRRTGTSTASKTFYAASTLDFVFETETLLSTDQEFDYRVTSGAAANVNVMGFSE